MRLQIVGRIQSPTVNYQTDEWKLRKVEAVGTNLKWLCKFTRPVVDSLIISSLNEVETIKLSFSYSACFHLVSTLSWRLERVFRYCKIKTWKIVE